MNHYKPRGLVLLGITYTASLVLVFGSIVLSPSFINVALAVDMPDAPVTQDTVTAGKDEDDNDDNDDNDQEDAVTQDTINVEEESKDNNDGDSSGQNNNDNNDDEPSTETKDVPKCPTGKEKGLFTNNCVPINIPLNLCGNSLNTAALLNPSFGNNCLNR